MASVSLTTSDLEPFADIDPHKAWAMIEDALAMAAVIAPCITEDDFAFSGAAKAILRGAVLRWNDSGSGALTQQGAGPFQVSYDNRSQRRSLFSPSEITALQGLCRTSGSGGAFSLDTVSTTTTHAETCSSVFGANYCDCGAVLAGFPLFS